MNASTAELCPVSERRTTHDLYLKLFVVLLTVLGSLAHLIHVRRDYGIAFVLIFFAFVSPIVTAVYLASLPLALIIQIVTVKGNAALSKEAVSVLIGPLPKDATSHDAVRPTGGQEAVEMSDMENQREAQSEGPHNEQDQTGKSSITIKSILRTILPLALIAQSTMSMFYFSQRCQLDSAALYDHYVFQLTLVGFLASILPLAQLFWHSEMESMHEQAFSRETKWLLALRATDASSEFKLLNHTEPRSRIWTRRALWTTYYLWIFSMSGVFLAGVTNASGLHVYFGLWVTRTAYQWMYQLQNHTPLIVVYCILVWLRAPYRDARIGWRFSLSKSLFSGAFDVIQIFTVCTLVCDFLLYVLATFVWNLQMFLPPGVLHKLWLISFHVPELSEWDSLASFAAAPVDSQCPKALKNEIEDFLWLLGS